MNIKVDKDFSVVHEAMAVDATGATVTAKEVLCAELPAAILAINAGIALVKNPVVKWIMGMVVNTLETLGASFCVGTEVK